MIAAGVVTFQPDIERLRENLYSIATQVDVVVVFDNGSANVADVAALIDSIDNVSLIKSPDNQGIATALNRISEWAALKGFEWLITLDQDSVAPSGMAKELFEVADKHCAAIVTPYIVDRNKLSVEDYMQMPLPRVDEYRQAARRGAITSGALTKLSVLFQVGGFDERFFIDYVDYDVNQRILMAGHKILRANRTYLLHEVGKAVETWLRVPRKDMTGSWRLETFYAFGHSAQRCYFKARNRVLFTRKYWRQIGLSHEGVWQLPQQIALTILFESDRGPKLVGFLRGFRDGLKLRLSETDEMTDGN